ncbi:MAG: polymer-forming cytoskeletal protein, partial [Candidatus Omnitrophota bacterium]
MLKRGKDEEKILDVDASMQGTLSFKDPVKLRINGGFEGKLDTKGSLIIGESASIRADIMGDEITAAGKVTGNILARKRLKVMSKAHIVGDVTAPVLSVEEGAVIHGRCHMLTGSVFNIDELARYLEVEISNIVDWANTGKIPAFKEGSDWKFERSRIDEWIAKERAK